MLLRYRLVPLVVSLVVLLVSACVSNVSDPTKQPVTMLDLQDVIIDISEQSPTELPTLTPDATNSLEPSKIPTDTILFPSASDVEITKTLENSSTPGCENQAEFVKHLNVSYNTQFKPDTIFAKVWLVKNTGTCIWSSDYKLIYYDGNLMGAPSEIDLPHEVMPGDMIELRVNLVAPTEPSTYNNQWMLKSSNGEVFGVGSSGNEPLQVKIIVVAPHIPVRG